MYSHYPIIFSELHVQGIIWTLLKKKKENLDKIRRIKMMLIISVIQTTMKRKTEKTEMT